MSKFKKIISCFLAITMILSVAWTINSTELVSYAAESEIENTSITIKGDGVENEITLTLDEIKALGMEKTTYSASNNFPSSKLVYSEGVSLDKILEKAGIKDGATLFTFRSSDGYERTFTKSEIIDDERFLFPDIESNSNDGKVKVATMIAFNTSEDSYEKLKVGEPILLMGQRSITEQNNPWFVKYLSEIEITTNAAEKWQTPAANLGSDTVEIGTEIVPIHKTIDAIKIYYTLDGTNPTVNSNLYNKSTTYFQPQLNVPIEISENTTLKMIAVGAGKEDSDVVTYEYKIAGTENLGDENTDSGIKGDNDSNVDGENSNISFGDLDGFDWATQSIYGLVQKNVINGIKLDSGDFIFNPSGSLTRGEFAKIMVLAMGEEQATYKKGFNDVNSGDWYSGYVEKAVELGILQGTGNGNFSPLDSVTKEQIITVALRCLGKGEEASNYTGESLKNFVNLEEISSWAIGSVGLGEELGILEHGNVVKVNDDGSLYFDGASNGTRAEAALIVYEAVEE